MPTADDGSATVNYGLAGNPSSSTAPIHGTNNLQAAIDRFDAAVSKLAGMYSQAASQSGGFKGNGTGGSSGLQLSNGGSGLGTGFIGQLQTQFSTGYKQAQAAAGGPPSAGLAGQMAHKAGGFIGSHPVFTQVATGTAMVGAAITAAGANSFDNQVKMSGFVTQQMGFLPAGQSNGAVQQRIMYGAFGSNTVAFNQADASAGANLISSMSGSASGYRNSAGNVYTSAANQAGYVTGQGFAAGAQMTQATYNGQTSLNALKMGLGQASGLILGGGQRGNSQINQALMKGIFQGRNKISTSAFNTSFNTTTGKGYADLVNYYGGNAQEAQDRVTQLQAYNKLSNAGYSAAQQTTLFNNAAANKGGAQGILSKLGINESDQQRINDLTSTKTHRTAELANGYNAGLTTSIDLLTKFNNALNRLLGLPGVSTAVGYGQGVAGTFKQLGHPGDLFGGGAGIVEVGRGISTLFGKGVDTLGKGIDTLGKGIDTKGIWCKGIDTKGIGGKGGPGGGGSPATALQENTVALDALTVAIYTLEGKSGSAAGGNRGVSTKAPGGKHRATGKHRGPNVAGRNIGSAVGEGAGVAIGETLGLGPEDPLSDIAAMGLGWLGNKVGGWIGGHFADGGVVSGSDMGHDSKTIAVRGGEGLLVPAAVRALGGPSAIHKINRRYGGGKKNKPKHYSQGGVVTGAEIDQYAEQFAGKTPYVWGGESSSSGWDCSGMAYSVYKHFGLANGMPRTSQAQWEWVKKTKTPQAGGLAFFAGSDGTQSSPGHVGIITGPNSMVDAYDTSSGTMNNTIQGSSGPVTGYGVPPKGFKSSGAGNGTSGNNSTSASASGSAATIGGATINSLGLSPGSYGSSNEVEAIAAALAGGIGGLSAGGNSGAPVSTTAGSPGGTSSSVSMNGITNSSGVAALKAAAAKMGWTGAQWTALQGVEAIEDSSYSLTAKNPGSKAYGMAQFINGPSEYAQYGGNATSYAGQATGMVNYVKQRYGTPVKALEHEHAFGYYADGTNNAAGGLSWVGERGPELMNLPAGAKVATNAASKNYAKGTAQTPWSAQLAGIPSGGSSAGGCSGHSVQITFGDIQIGASSSGSSTSMAQNAREFIRETKRQLEQEELFMNIAAGAK